MRATIKRKLPDAPAPTKAVRIDRPERPFYETLYDKEMGRTEKQPPKPDAKRREWTQEEIDLMLEMHEHGMKNVAIARKLGRSQGNISMRLAEALKGKKRKWIPRKERKRYEGGESVD